LLLDDDGIMLSDISGECMLLDDGYVRKHDAVIIEEHAFP
jgi:hypothetical protein